MTSREKMAAILRAALEGKGGPSIGHIEDAYRAGLSRAAELIHEHTWKHRLARNNDDISPWQAVKDLEVEIGEIYRGEKP